MQYAIEGHYWEYISIKQNTSTNSVLSILFERTDTDGSIKYYFLLARNILIRFHPLELPGICSNLYLKTGNIEIFLEGEDGSEFYGLRDNQWVVLDLYDP